jgi:hypothetical protein
MAGAGRAVARVLGVLTAVVCGALAAGGSGAAEPPGSASGTFTVAKDGYSFGDAVAFRTTRLNMAPGEQITVVVLTSDPIDRVKVAAAVAAEGNWTASEHKVRFILRFDAKGKLAWGMFQAGHRNVGLMNLAPVSSELSVAGKQAKGRASLTQPGDFLGEPYTFDVSFQAEVVAGS